MKSRSTSKTFKRRRRLRRIALFFGVLIVMIGAGLFIITRPTILAIMIQASVGELLGGDVSIEQVRVESNQRVVLHNVTLRVPGIKGSAGEIINAETVIVNASVVDLLSGSAKELAVTLRGATLRMSEDRSEPGRYAFMDLQSSDDEDDQDAIERLVINIEGGTLESGSHDADGYKMHGTMPIAGTLYATPDAPDWLTFELAEIDQAGRAVLDGGLRVRGRVNLQTTESEGRIDGLKLTEQIKSLGPERVRGWWDMLEVDGEVSGVGIAFTPDEGFWMEAEVRDIGLTIPIRSERIWARYNGSQLTPAQGRPRMRVESGKIELLNGRIKLDNLRGEVRSTVDSETIAGVPYIVNGTIGPVPDLVEEERSSWLVTLVESTPVDLTFYLDGFAFDATAHGANSVVELPAVVTRVLEDFQLQQCTLETSITVVRDPDTDSGGDLRSSGSAFLTNGVGAYEKFPYPLRNVRGEMTFDQDEVTIVSLLGDAAGGGSVSLSGRVYPITKWPNVQLRISGSGIPLDDSLREALGDSFHAAYDQIMHRPSFDALREMGAFRDEEDRARLETRATALLRQPDTGEIPLPDEDEPGGNVAPLRAAREAASINRALGLPTFSIGGRVDFELEVHREQGQGRRVETTGTIDIRNAGLLLDRFPYPVHIERGRILLETEVATLQDWVGVGYGGGQVFINGTVETRRVGPGKRIIRPSIQIGVVDDLMNEALIGAVELAGRQVGDNEAAPDATPSILDVTADALRSAGVQAMMTYDGVVSVGDNNEPTWDIGVFFSNGVLQPEAMLTDVVRQAGLIWPEGFSLDNLSGGMQFTSERILIEQLTGTRDEGRVVMNGWIEGGTNLPDASIEISFENFAIEEYLLNLFPRNDVARVHEFWRRYEPTGTFDASLTIEHRKGVRQPLVLNVIPGDVHLRIDGATLRARGRDGRGVSVRLSDRAVEIEGLALDLSTGDRDNGTIMLNGRYGEFPGGPSSLRLSGEILDARFESPWVREAVRRLGPTSMIEELQSRSVEGRFDASFAIESDDPANRASWREQLVVAPETLSLNVGDGRVIASFAEGGRVYLSDNLVRAESLRGVFLSGSRFGFDGTLRFAPRLDAELSLAFEGNDLSELMRVMPSGVDGALDAIALQVEDELSFEGAVLTIEQSGDDAYATTIDANLAVRGAAFETGFAFDEINGTLELHASKQPDTPLALSMDIHADHARIDRRVLSDVRAMLTVSETGRTLLMPVFRGRCYNGTVAATAAVVLGDSGRYLADVNLVGVNLNHFMLTSIPSEDEGSSASSAEIDEGEIYGGISVEGVLGEPSTRRGRGNIRLMDADLAANPVTMSLLQLSQLMLPLNASMRYAEADMFILGERLVFEDLRMEGDQLHLFGEGAMDLQDYTLDIRLRPRGTMVGLSDIVGSLNDQLFAIHLTGTLEATSASIVPLPSLGGFFNEDLRVPPAPRRTLIESDN